MENELNPQLEQNNKNSAEVAKIKEKDKSARQMNKRRCPAKFIEEEKEGKKGMALKMVKDEEGSFIQKLTGTPNEDLALKILAQSVSALPDSSEAGKNNLILQTLADFNPKDAIEARLCAQAATLYARGMRYFNMAESCLQDLSDGECRFFEAEGLVNAHNNQTQIAIKLLRLHNETIEALSRLRRGNDQKITVQHVNVNDGGKAIVNGNLTTGEGGRT